MYSAVMYPSTMSFERVMIVFWVLYYQISEGVVANTLLNESATPFTSSPAGGSLPEYLPLRRQVVATEDITSHDDEYAEIEKFKSYVFEYKYGKRVYGDELILCDTKAFTFPTQDVSLQLQYPKETDTLNAEFSITHFRLFVKQDSPKSQALMAQGLEEEKDLTLGIIITAGKARRVTFSIRIYGVPLNIE